MNQANLRCLGHSVSVGAKERTTMTLKEKIVAKVAGCGMNCDPSEIADRILEIPELKEALDLHPGLYRPNLGHSISTGTRKA
jgi:hypothetical protein